MTRRNAGLLVGVTCWCPREAHGRAEQAAQCLVELVAQAAPHSAKPGWDVVVVNNDVEHQRLRDAIERVEREPWVTVLHLAPQRGWGGGRNAQLEFFMAGAWSHIVMFDQDLRIGDPLWLSDMEEIAVAEDLHGFMLISVMSDMRGVIKLPKGRLAWVSREFMGGVHAVSRHAVQTVGGYNLVDFPEPWGFHDCEYGLRLRAAGLLDASEGQYVDPIMRTVLHADGTQDDQRHSAMKQRVVAQYYPVFLRRAAEIELGRELVRPLGWPTATSDSIRP